MWDAEGGRGSYLGLAPGRLAWLMTDEPRVSREVRGHGWELWATGLLVETPWQPSATRWLGLEVACPQPQLSLEPGRTPCLGVLSVSGGQAGVSAHTAMALNTFSPLPSSLLSSRPPPTP